MPLPFLNCVFVYRTLSVPVLGSAQRRVRSLPLLGSGIFRWMRQWGAGRLWHHLFTSPHPTRRWKSTLHPLRRPSKRRRVDTLEEGLNAPKKSDREHKQAVQDMERQEQRREETRAREAAERDQRRFHEILERDERRHQETVERQQMLYMEMRERDDRRDTIRR